MNPGQQPGMPSPDTVAAPVTAPAPAPAPAVPAPAPAPAPAPRVVSTPASGQVKMQPPKSILKRRDQPKHTLSALEPAASSSGQGVQTPKSILKRHDHPGGAPSRHNVRWGVDSVREFCSPEGAAVVRRLAQREAMMQAARAEIIVRQDRLYIERYFMFATVDGNQLPTLHFENPLGHQGRLQMEHPNGPAIQPVELYQRRLFFPSARVHAFFMNEVLHTRASRANVEAVINAYPDFSQAVDGSRVVEITFDGNGPQATCINIQTLPGVVSAEETELFQGEITEIYNQMKGLADVNRFFD